MQQITQEWIEKAEGDFRTAIRELSVQRDPNYDAVCFHSQQCAEKYLKAQLQEEEIDFGKTHNLMALLDLLITRDQDWESLRSAVQGLSAFAVEVRYPGTSVDQEIAAEALDLSQEVRQKVRSTLG